MNKIVARLKEPSTYAGVAALLASLGVAGLSEDQWLSVAAAVAGVAGVVAMFLGERGSE